MSTEQTTSVASERLARVAAAEAELAGLRAERDALREQNEALLAENESMSRNLDEALAHTDSTLGYQAARWFTAADVEPDDERLELCSPHDGIVFTRTPDGYWRTPHLSNIHYDWSQVVEHAPLLAVDSHANRATLAELDRRREDGRQAMSALWNADRALLSQIEVYGGTELSNVNPIVAELREQVRDLGKTHIAGNTPTAWSANAMKALGLVVNAVVRLHSQQRDAARRAPGEAKEPVSFYRLVDANGDPVSASHMDSDIYTSLAAATADVAGLAETYGPLTVETAAAPITWEAGR